MRKKISNILMGILLIFAGVFVTACGDKYKDFEFKISYAFSENAETWYDANNGISLNYEEDDKGTLDISDDEYVFSINGKEERVAKNNFNIYLKAEVKNVKSKYLDSITVSAQGASGLAFSSSTIKNGKIVKLPVVGLVNSQLSLYENKSGRSTKINLSVYGKIKNLTRNDAITPVIVVDGTLDLYSIRDLIFYNKDGIITNQTGVTYEIVDFGYFTSLGEYKSDSLANNQLNVQYLSLADGKLKLNKKRTVLDQNGFELTNSNNVIRLKATSNYSPVEPTTDNPEISTNIYVYVVGGNFDEPLLSPVVKFDGTDTDVNSSTLTNKGIDLYFNSSKESVLDQYTNSTVLVDGVNGIYRDGIYTSEGRLLKFKVKAYIGDSYSPYEFGSDVPVRNLKISENDNKYNIALANQSSERAVNVKFAYELVCEKDEIRYPITFNDNKSKPVLETNIEVRKHILSSSIIVNGKNYNGTELEQPKGVVYSTSYEKYTGFKAELGVEPLDGYNPQTIKISGIGNLNVLNRKGFKVSNDDKLANGETLNIKFASGVYNNQTAVLEVLKTPEYFNGQAVPDAQYISVKLELTRKVTADALEFVDGNNLSNAVTTTNVATTKTSYVFVKAYYQGRLDVSTITLSSNNFALDTNGNKQISLTDETPVVDGNDDKGYKIFKVAIPATGNLSTSKLEVYAGEYGNGAISTTTVNSVDLINNPENIKILAKRQENVKDFNNNKFAVVKGKEVLFNVVETVGSSNVQNTIHKVTLIGKTITGVNGEHFGDAEVLTKTEFGDNTFSVYGWNAKTRVVDVNVQYYSQNKDGVILLETKTLSNVQFAVYNPITNISINVTKDKIAYVNSLFPEAATTEISYSTYSGVGAEVPTEVVYFVDWNGAGWDLDGETGKNATSVNVSINKDLSGNKDQVKLFRSTGATYIELDNVGTTLCNKVSNNGVIKLQLINSLTGLNNIKFIVTANQFDKETTVVNDVNVIIASVDRATGIDVIRGDIVEYSNENRELQMSFMGITDGMISKEFAVKPVYANAIPNISSLQFQDFAWQLYKYDFVEGNWLFNENKQITNFTNSLNVLENNGEFTIIADKSISGIGGLYKLVVSIKDSYQTATGKYNVQWELDIRINDGKTEQSAYLLTTADDVAKINTDLNAYYVLGNNITIPADKLAKPIGFDGTNAAAFTGSLSGRLTTSASIFNFNLNVTVGNDKIDIGTGGSTSSLYGLFSILEGTISNLNISITFDNIATEGRSTIGGIVAVNRGIIENVNITLNGKITINNATNFGGLVGLNADEYIDKPDGTKHFVGQVKNCIVNLSQGLIINAKAASNIGGIVGENNGTIVGQYEGKESLNEIKYDNIINIIINNNADNITYNIGAVAGISSKDITKMLVGGKIILISKKEDGAARPLNNGYLAGIVGSTSANVENVAAVGLDLINEGKNGIKIAGIAGAAANIKDARFVSVLAKFSGFETTGQLVGKEVAGISHNANVEYSTVESFIKTTENAEGVKSTFYTFEGETVYGLIKSGSVSNSFVSANIKATNAYLTSENNNKNATYFIGKVVGTQTINSTYAVVYNTTDFVEISGFTFNEDDYNSYIETAETISLKESWLTEVSKLEGFEVDGKYNIVNISKYQGIDFYFPYIVKDGSPLMILQPDSIKAEINQDYQIDIEENIYVGDADIKDKEEDPTYEITESIVVDFFENKYDNYENKSVNKHKLINDETDDGLIDLTLLPANVTAGLTFELVANYGGIAQFDETGTYLILTGVTESKPIILRAYSMFNPEAEAYFAIYSQRTYSELVLEGSNVTKLDEQDYAVNVYQGRNTTIALTADNIKKGESYDSILTNNSHMVEVEAIIDETNLKFDYEKEPGVVESLNKFSFNTNNLSSIIISINEKYNAQPNDEFDVILNVYLSKEYFNGLNNRLLLDTIKLKVNLNNVATKLDIVGANDFEIDSSSTLNFEASLKTGFVDAIQHQECLVEVDDNGIVIVDKANIEKKDSIRMNIYSTSAELIRIKTETGANSFAKLFNFDVYETKTADGYNYEVSLALKDEFNFRYVTSNIDLVVNIWAASNPNVMNAVNVTIKPTTANTIRLDNYAITDVNIVSNTKSELTMGQVETSIISPGGRGNMLLAYVEKSYSNLDSITITSSELFVPELNRNVNLVFTQYVYNKVTRKFETLFNSNVQAQNGNTLELQKVTTIENGKTEYTGILYIHAQLIKVSGLEAKISATLNVVSNGISIPSVTEDMLTTFLPGASLTYNGIQANNGYLVQESTYGNTARIKLYGYQFNSNPEMLMDWELDYGSNYKYVLNADNTEIKLSSLTDTNGNSSTEDEKIALLKPYLDDGYLYYYLSQDIAETKDEKTIVKQTKGYYKAKSVADFEKANTTFYSISNKKLIWIDANNNNIVDGSEQAINIANYVSTYFVEQYDKVDYNPVDGSYSMDVLFNIAQNLPANFSLQAKLKLITSNGQFEESFSEKIMFYPTKYVVTDIAVKDTAGNRKMLAINRTDKLDFLFSTLRGDYDYSRAIYDGIFISQIADLKALFSYFDPTEKTFNNENSAFKVDVKNNFLSITGLSTFEREITLKVYVGYKFVNGKYEIVFGEQGASNVRLLTYSFTLQIYPGATEENANPIYSATDMFDENGNSRLAENGHYILMNDITLDLVKPIENIGSLDGNNHIIKIKNFVIDPGKTEYGLFANIGTYQDEEGKTHKSILKNVIVDYSEFNVENSGNIEFINNNMTSIKFGGLVATNNGGLIYNCDVVNSTASSDKVINILVDENANITFGGLVGTNSGIITNSRVGRRDYKDIDAVNDTFVNTTFGGLEFVLGNVTKSGFEAIAGGFVGENSGTISSSYFANSSLINYANSNETNITAGFAGKNNSNSTIAYSYVKANETTITSTQPYATGNRIENKSNGIVAGFVYENAGTINDCYANTELYTDSTYVSGFVYENLSGARISESYAACTMKTASGETQNNAQQPFVGRDNENKYLNAGAMENNYYLLNTDGSGDIRQAFAQALNVTNFKNSNNLQGFVFVQSNVEEERQQGVWSHIDIKGNALILPELMNANIIASSAKYLLSNTKDENGITKYTYTNADSIGEGTRYNPYIIRNVQEFNATLTGNRDDMSDATSKSGYIRLIDSINFGEDHEAIKTRINYTLGNEYRSNLTSFEGNGLNIEGIYFDNPQTQTGEMGLFAKIQNAYIKNVNLSFVKPKNGVQYGTTNVKYSGGLAGIITNSAIINVNLDGKDVSLTGQNYVGGVAGLVNGDSLLYGISSNLSVSADSSETSLYYNEADYAALGNSDNYNQYISKLSYAGGIAGVIDITKRAGTDYNVSFIDVYGDQMFTKATEQQLPNIEGQYAGGIAGFAGRNVSALKLKYHTGSSDWISGSEAAGGIFAVSLGRIMASQVTAIEDTQFNYDTEFGKYVLDIENGLDRTKVGNLNLIESNGYAGGLIGIGLNAGIDASYAKAGFRNGKVIGGLIGLSVATNVTYSYALPFVNLTDTTKEVGGLIGSAQIAEKGFNYNSDPLRKYKELVKVYLNRDLTSSSIAFTDIQFTFSTVLVEKSQLTDKGVNYEDLTNSPIQIGYLVPNVINNANVNALKSGSFTTYSNVYEGRLEDYAYTLNNVENIYPIFTTEKSKEAKLNVIYNLAHTSQETTFNEVFSSWKVISYWTLNNEKYFPLLTNEGVENYTLIYNANDLKQIASNPDGKFKVMEDINMSNFETAGNWVFGITFRGELIGEIDSETQIRKRIYNIALTPNQENESSGFFQATEGAIISDLEFVWNDGGQSDVGAINSSVNLTDVSGLSCLDSYYEDGENIRFSEFNNIEVSVSGDGYLIKPKEISSGVFTTINSFGGIVTSTQNSLIINCDFVGKVDVVLTEDSDVLNPTKGNAYFGGIVGKAEKSLGDGNETLQNSSMSIMNSKVGANGENTSKAKTSFNVKVAGATQAYIGGAIGHITKTSVLGISVGGVQYEDGYQTVKLEVNINNDINNKSQQIAGLIGYCHEESSVDGSNVSVEISVSGDTVEKGYTTTIAGLIATYNGKMGIVNSNAKSDIDVAELKTSTLLVAGGVASLSSTEFDVLKQCLFTGRIIGETLKEDGSLESCAEASVIYAGGTVAETSGTMQISETMSTVDVTIGAIEKLAELYAGGFVGKVSGPGNTLTLNNVVSSGKLVPFCGKLATKVHLGGMVGSIEDNAKADIVNSYTVTSIIADAIAGKALQNTYSDALVGYAKKTVDAETGITTYNATATNVYFSTDFALTTNDKNLGTNIAGTEFVYSSNDLWKDSFVSPQESMWKFILEDTYGYLPYIKSLEDSLKTYKVLQIDAATEKYNYVLGSSLRPFVIYEDRNFETDKNINNDFNYYILNKCVTLTNELHGVLIGNDVKLTTNVGNLITKIGKHSAVSNIHLNVETPSTIVLSGGFVVKENNGLIFNCSVQGEGINIEGYVGVIADANNGTVAYSYSSIEILSVGSASGIVYTNNGVINSCYFTGYINSGTASAGIMLNATGDDVYVYNNYMAGVITNISSVGTSFYAANIANFDGKNNYIDQFANNELGIDVSREIGTQNEYIVLKSFTTAELMSRYSDSLFKGEWYKTVNEVTVDKDGIPSGGKIDTKSNKDGIVVSAEAGSDEKTFLFENIGSFGYNYGYPIYKFNKLNTSDPELLSCSDIAYSLETGTGTDNSDLASRYTNIHSSLYENAYKIPHLGVMSALHGLQGESRNYVVIYDITGKASRKDAGAMIEWNGICSTDKNTSTYGFNAIGAFNGVLVTNKNLTNTFDANSTDYICTIEGLNKSGLFNEIGVSYIADIVLGSLGEKEGLTNSGAIGKTIVDETTINNITFAKDSIIIGNNFGGLFGSVQANLTILNFHSENESLAAVTLQGTGIAGLIASELNGGTINLDTTLTPTNYIYPFFKGVSTAGGLVGTAIAGTINGNSNIIHIANNVVETIGSYGGIVGSVPVDGNVTINGVNVEFANNAVVSADSLGGFVSKVAGTVKFTGCSIVAPEGISEWKISINSQTDVESQKGLLVGEIASGSVTIAGFVLNKVITITCNGSKGDNSSIGGFVGTQNGDLNLEIGTLNEIKLNAQNTPNLGGIIGIYNDGNINVSGTMQKITLNGYKNVGGFIGQANAWPKMADKLVITKEDESTTELDAINFLNTSAFAKIKISMFAEANFGGLFGLLTTGNTETPSVDTGVINNNEFEIVKNDGSQTRTVSNIGGIAGFVNDSTAVFENLKNEEDIDGTTETNYIFKNVGGIFGNFNGKSIKTATNNGAITIAILIGGEDAISNATVDTGEVEDFANSIAINIGGIIGLGNNTGENLFEFTDLNNTAEISGYQNVGGIIGYANKVNVTTGSQTGNVAGVINVGGALGCVQESEITGVKSTAKVYGNTNVGGLIGLSNENKLTENQVEGSSTTETIKAIYYNVYELGKTDKDYVSYIPTSVGGLIGASQNTTIKANTVKNVQITSTDEGKETGSLIENSKGMISTISNYMVNAGTGTGSKLNDLITMDAVELKSNADKLKFGDLTSGFGGFVGTLDNTSGIIVETEEPEEPEVETTSAEVTNNTIENLTIKASLGINVGTYYGYYNHGETFNVPSLSGTIKVDGGYNVGGMAGKTTGENISFSNSALSGNGTINLQSQLSGMYIGGLIGELNSNTVTEIKMENSNVNIKIYTNSSYYIGGLVGKLVVTSENTFNGDAEKVTIADNNDNVQNFGGLVGMLKITGPVATYSVSGNHNFPFTVNTIENQNYADGRSRFDTELSEDNVNLYAQANYINQDSFNISATKGDYYGANGATYNNPLNKADSWGWAKEYTGFKQIQRCIPMSKNKGASWDSIAVVYNAEWITEVGTVGNLNLVRGNECELGCSQNHTHTTIRKDDDGKLYYFRGSSPDPVLIDNQHIVYTVYKKNQDVEMLYSAIGIAEIAQIAGKNVNSGNSDTTWYTSENGFIDDETRTIAEYYYVRNLDEEGKLFGYYRDTKDKDMLGQKTLTDPIPYFCTSSKPSKDDLVGGESEASVRGVIRSINEIKLDKMFYFNWVDNIDYITCVEPDEKLGGTNAIGRTQAKVKLHYYKSESDKFYDFKIIYANDTLEGHGFAKSGSIDSSDVPNSGSVFEVYGLNPSLTDDTVERPATGWEKNGWWITIIIEVVITIATWGAGAYINGIVKAGWHAFHKGHKVTKALGRTWRFLKKMPKILKYAKNAMIAITALTGVLAGFSSNYSKAVSGSKSMYYETKNQNIGLLTTTTITEIKYQNNTMVGSLGSVVTKVDKDGQEYEFYFYSNVRPSDYYKNYYIVTKQSFEENKDLLEQGFTEGISFGNTSIKNIGNLYSFNFEYDDAGVKQTTTAELKYIYHEGAYYVNSSSMMIGKYRTQELSDPSVVAQTEAQSVYGEDGIAYVRGNYSDGTYSFKNELENKVTYDEDSKKYSLNSNTDLNGEKEVDVEFIAYGSGYGAEEGELEGYDYLSNAYYTTLGTPDTSDEKTYTKYATFSYWGPTTIDTTGYTLGVDYIQASYTLVENVGVGNGRWYEVESTYYELVDSDEDGDLTDEEMYNDAIYRLTPNQTAYFKISSMSDSGTISSLGSLTMDELSSSKVTLAAYPTCFKDPYKNAIANSQDIYSYVAKATNNTATGPVFKFKVKYYYFEGGYMLWQELTKSTDENHVLYNSIYRVTSIEGIMANGGSIYVYNEDGANEFINIVDLNSDGTISNKGLIIKNGETYSLNLKYADWYTISVKDIGKCDIHSTFTPGCDECESLKNLKDLYKVSNNYIVHGGNIYVRDSSYCLDKEGYINKMYAYNNIASKDIDFVANRYLSYHEEDGYKGVYTVFKYSETLYYWIDKDGIQKTQWTEGGKYYNLIPTNLNRSRPNSSVNATYLVESCNVILGGGKTLKYNNGTKSGQIIIV